MGNSVWDLRHLQRALKERKEGSWQLFLLERTPKDFFVPAQRAWAFVWLRPWVGGRLCAAVCPPPAPRPRLRVLVALPVLSALGTQRHCAGCQAGRGTKKPPPGAPDVVCFPALRDRGSTRTALPLVSRVVHGQPAARGPPCLQLTSVPRRQCQICALCAGCPRFSQQPLPPGVGLQPPVQALDSRAVPSMAAAWSEEQDACREEPWEAVSPRLSGTEWGGQWGRPWVPPGLAAVGLSDPQGAAMTRP